MTDRRRTIMLAVALLLIIGSIWYLESRRFRPSVPPAALSLPTIMDKAEKTKKYPKAKEISSPDGFINTDHIALEELIGKKVVLIDFWTYSCINCQRTIPYLNAWHDKYADKGLVIIGIHTPEFKFEQNYDNVSKAVIQFGIKYPVVLDNDYSTWYAYLNRYWPSKYLIDIDGYIVYNHAGEGAYEETERKIQDLLEERQAVLGERGEIRQEITRPSGAPEVDFSLSRSPEIYFGARRNLYLGNGKSNVEGVQILKEPVGMKTNILYLAGEWDFQDEYARNISQGSKIIFRYQAKGVYMVASAKEPIKARILLDGKSLFPQTGGDLIIDGGNSILTVQEERLYKIIEDAAHSEHTLEIIIPSPGLTAFTFTFG
ncbi:MAG: redoxin domain-containing protein [Parcubacteria group bacterium]|nr:redoxin domain-containing protein [Parcubacteria group bacterium]